VDCFAGANALAAAKNAASTGMRTFLFAIMKLCFFKKHETLYFAYSFKGFRHSLFLIAIKKLI
jgi:hypothetical protein